MMIPNENYLKYFGDVELPQLKAGVNRSSCIRIGAFLVIRKILEEYELPAILEKHLGIKDCGLFLDLAAYSIVAENNAAWYYPDYAYNHPLFTAGMHIYSDSKVWDFFASVTDDKNLPVFIYAVYCKIKLPKRTVVLTFEIFNINKEVIEVVIGR